MNFMTLHPADKWFISPSINHVFFMLMLRYVTLVNVQGGHSNPPYQVTGRIDYQICCKIELLPLVSFVLHGLPCVTPHRVDETTHCSASVFESTATITLPTPNPFIPCVFLIHILGCIDNYVCKFPVGHFHPLIMQFRD